MKTSILKIMAWALAALIIPLAGNQFVEGWNWQWHDFIFAWVFWVIMSFCILFATKRFTTHRVIVGVVVFLFFASIWIMLARG